ncbi:MAG: TonB-dependent receptor, partial [Xanthomonadales bacterium]|nr:TonB-dependent receptor [Xanthomonadales bacterium]
MPQALRRAEWQVLQRQRLVDRQAPARCLGRGSQGVTQQAGDPGAMRGTRLLGALEHPQGHGIAEIHQGRIRGQPAGGSHLLRDVRKVPARSPGVAQLQVGLAGERRARPRLPACAQPGQVAGIRQHPRRVAPRALVMQLEAHLQVRRQAHHGEIRRAHHDARGALQERREHLGQRLVARRLGLGEGAREIRCRHEVAAQALGQATDQLGYLAGQQAGHQPFAARRRQRIQQGQGHMQGHAIGGIARQETVFEPIGLPTRLQLWRKRGRVGSIGADEHVVGRPAQGGLRGPEGSINTATQWSTSTLRNYTANGEVNVPFTTLLPQMLTVGVEYWRQTLDDPFSMSQSSTNGGGIPGLQSGTRNSNSSADLYAFFLEDNIAVGERLTLTPGIRFDHHSEFGWNVSPALNASLDLGSGFTLKGGIARAFKAPNLYQSNPNYLYYTMGNGCP